MLWSSGWTAEWENTAATWEKAADLLTQLFQACQALAGHSPVHDPSPQLVEQNYPAEPILTADLQNHEK